MKAFPPKFLLAFLGVIAFTSVTSLELRATKWNNPTRPSGAFTKLLGEGRRLFANQFITMADVYLHSGYYPSIFDQANPRATKAIVSGDEESEDHDQRGHENHQHDEKGACVHDDEHEKAMDFMSEPRNWLDGFIRRFRITEHTHLEKGNAREVLPWLRVAIELDPQKIETYTSTAYWLSEKLGRSKDAEQVLREGIRNNPNSAQLLFEMGLLQYKGNQDAAKARNIWLLALRRWEEQSGETKKETPDVLDRIAVNLAKLEESSGNLQEAITYYEMAVKVAPNPEAVQKSINEIKSRIADSSTSLKPVP